MIELQFCGQGGVVFMKRRRGCLHSFFLLVLTAVILIGFWYFENNVIQTEVFELASRRLPAAFDGFRIVELADLHGRQFGPGGEDLLRAVREAEPDLIALDGDLADEHTDLEVIRTLAQGLTEIAPTYYVTGNHEWVMDDLDALLQILEDAGVTVLHNTYYQLTLEGQSILLAGVDDPNGPYDQKTPAQLVEEIRGACGDAYLVMLAHRNDQLGLWAELEVDTVLTGHGHGGIIRLPLVGGLVGTDRSLFPDYTAGLYSRGRTNMIVSRGLGNSGVNFRLFNRPHLPVIVLRTAPPGEP